MFSFFDHRGTTWRRTSSIVLPVLALLSLAFSLEATGATVTLRWTAPGDDGDVGRASFYDFKISQALIADSNWSSVTRLTGEPTPGPAGTTDSFTITNLQPGITYYVAAKVGDESLNWSQLSNNAVFTIPEEDLDPDFTADPLSGNAPLTVQFTDLSGGDPVAWKWDFGDGGTSTIQNPTYVYNDIGLYTVALTATNADGSNGKTKTGFITVTSPPCDVPVADFSGSPKSGSYPLNVSFTDASTNSPISWSWTFGDGGTSTAQNPSYTYAAPGTYTISLTATNSCGSDSETKTGNITVTEPHASDFCDDFQDAEISDWTILLDEWSVSDGQLDGYIDSEWAFILAPAGTVGDCIISVDWTSLAGGTWTNGIVVFAYEDAQNYRVADCRDGANQWYIREFIGGTQYNRAELSETINTNQQYAVEVVIDPSGLVSVNVDGVPKVSYGFGNVVTGQVGLKVNQSHSQFDNFCVYAEAPTSLPVAAFSATPISGSAPLAVSFTDESTGDITSRSWDFGDGGSSHLSNPQHTYQEAGTYSVQLAVSNASGAHSLIKSNLIVASDPGDVTGVRYLAESESTESGTVVGTYHSINERDSIVQTIVEALSGGESVQQYSTLEHEWIFQVTSSNELSFHLVAQRPNNLERDDFLFEYSVDDCPFRSLVLVDSDLMTMYSAYMPNDVHGIVRIRVVDTDHTVTDSVFDSLFIDQMYIEQDGTPVPQDTVFVQKIEAGQSGRLPGMFRATATVEVGADRRFPASGVQVFGHFEDACTGQPSGFTESDGKVVLFSDPVRFPDGEWLFTVDSLRSEGRVYASAYNATNFATDHFHNEELPVSIELYDNYPNPFNPFTTIEFWLPSDGHVRVDVLNILGQTVEVLLDEWHPAGSYSVYWNGYQHASGIYFYRMQAGGSVEARKMMLLK